MERYHHGLNRFNQQVNYTDPVTGSNKKLEGAVNNTYVLSGLFVDNIAPVSGNSRIALATTPTQAVGTNVWSRTINITEAGTIICLEINAVIDSTKSANPFVFTVFRGSILIGILSVQLSTTGIVNTISCVLYDDNVSVGSHIYSVYAGLVNANAGTWYIGQNKTGVLFGTKSTQVSMSILT
jgi:hypothetical protein